MARTFFEEFLAAHPVSGPGKTMPLTHGAKAVTLRDILRSGTIELPRKDCEVLGGKYIFSFYGRPAYRPIVKPDGLRKSAGATTYLIFKSTVIKDAHRAHPLDTGAFASKFYEKHVDAALNATDFGFAATEENIRKLVSLYFQNNESYMHNSPRPGLNLPDGEDEAQALHDIFQSGAAGGDDRDTAIEIIFDKPIPVNASSIQCAVVPDILENADNYGKILKALGVDIITYNFRRGYGTTEYHSAIADALYDYYVRCGLI